MTRNEEQRVQARVSHLTSHQIADRILTTDLAVHLDSMGYSERRVSLAEKRADNLSGARSAPPGQGRES